MFVIQLSVNGHVGGFHPLATVKSAAVNVCVQAFARVPDFNSSGSVPRRIAGQSVDSVSLKEQPSVPHQGSNFSTIFGAGYPNRCEEVEEHLL